MPGEEVGVGDEIVHLDVAEDQEELGEIGGTGQGFPQRLQSDEGQVIKKLDGKDG